MLFENYPAPRAAYTHKDKFGVLIMFHMMGALWRFEQLWV